MAWLLILLLALGWLAAYLLFKRFTAREVQVNAEAIKANGSADDLRKGFHQRRSWVRFWPWLALSVGGSAVALLSNYWSFGISFAGLGILLAGYFARWFTPLLNLAMGLDYKPEDYASPDSASWPDAKVWKKLRAAQPLFTNSMLQAQANAAMRKLLVRTWRVCLGLAGLLFIASCSLIIVNGLHK